jgi:Nitrate/nitrite transporter
LSDRVGRKPVLAALSLGNLLLPMTMFALMASGSHARALLGAVVLAALAGGVSAVGAVATAEQFPGEGRVTGLALGATGATAIYGGLTPFVAQLLIERTGWEPAPGAMIALVSLCVLPRSCGCARPRRASAPPSQAAVTSLTLSSLLRST